MSIMSLLPVIKDVKLAAAAASVEIAVPSGYEILFLEWHDVYGDNATGPTVELTLISGAGGYDDSYVAAGGASSTTNASNGITIGTIDTAAANEWHSNGEIVIFNRTAQEKVVIGQENRFIKGTTNPEDLVRTNIQGKDRDTSDPITKITITPSAGNFIANSRFILRGLNLKSAPSATNSPDLVRLIGTHTVSGAEASVTLPTIPPGFSILMLFWHDVFSDADDRLRLKLNADTGAVYDYSSKAFGTASTTTNASTFQIEIGNTSNVSVFRSSGFLTIFNRKGQEKVGIGTEVHHDKSGGGTDEDIIGFHNEFKWRNTADEISAVELHTFSGNLDAGKFYLIGLRLF